MKFVILGHVTIDKNITEGIHYTAPGGPPNFITRILKQLPNAETIVIAPYGKDYLLFNKSLNIYPRQHTTLNNLIFYNITKNGKRTQKVFHSSAAVPITIDNHLSKIVRKADVLFITPLLPLYSPKYLKKIVSLVSKKTLKILLPQGYFRQVVKHQVKAREFIEAKNILPLVDVVIISDEDHLKMEQTALKWVKEYNLMVIITLAEKGALILKKKQKIPVPTQSVAQDKIVDAVGSGDIFSAAFAYRFAHTRELINSVKFANQIARQYLFYTPKNPKNIKIKQDSVET